MDQPDLQKLVRHYGAYSRVPHEVWLRYERALEDWKHSISLPHADPEGKHRGNQVVFTKRWYDRSK